MANKGVVTEFAARHIGTYNPEDLKKMLKVVKAESLDQLIEETIPSHIRVKKSPNIPGALTEQEYLRHMQGLAAKNKVFR